MEKEKIEIAELNDKDLSIISAGKGKISPNTKPEDFNKGKYDTAKPVSPIVTP